jgi:hypothetical protein
LRMAREDLRDNKLWNIPLIMDQTKTEEIPKMVISHFDKMDMDHPNAESFYNEVTSIIKNSKLSPETEKSIYDTHGDIVKSLITEHTKNPGVLHHISGTDMTDVVKDSLIFNKNLSPETQLSILNSDKFSPELKGVIGFKTKDSTVHSYALGHSEPNVRNFAKNNRNFKEQK